MAEHDDDFLARWSRRKSEAKQGLHKTATPDDAGLEAEARQAALQNDAALPDVAEEGSHRPHAADAEGGPAEGAEADDFADVDFDALDYESDYGRFMKDGVPDAIRRRALKQLWKSNPILANLDGLNDYDEDFTDAALAVEVLETAYKVGRGYLTDEDLAEMEDDDADAEEAVAEAEPEVATGDDLAAEADGAPEEATDETAADTAPPEDQDHDRA